MRLFPLSLCLIASSCPSYALDPTLRISQYQKRTWRIEDALPQNYVTSLLQISDGTLIVGTSGGAARFDGFQFSPIVLDPSTGISREWITSLSEQPRGTLWISTRDAGLYEISSPGARPHSEVAVAFDSVAGHFGLRAGLWRLSDSWRRISDLNSTDLSWQGLIVLPDGDLLAATNEGVVRVHGGSSELLIPEKQLGGRPLSFAPRRSGGIWLGTTSGLFLLPFANFRSPQKIPSVPGPVVSVVEDREGQIWAATWGFGLHRISAQSTVAITSADGLPDDFVHALLEDSEGALWIGTRGGLSRWTTPLAVPFGPTENLSALYVSAVTPTRHGTAWFGSWRNGLYELTQAGFRKQPIPTLDLETTIRSAAVSLQDELLISTTQGVCRRSAAGQWQMESPNPASTGFTLAMLFDRTGQLWAGGSSGLFQYPDGRIGPHGHQRLRDVIVSAIVEDKAGSIWAATSQGLFQLTNQTTNRITGLPHPFVTSLAEDRRGRIWGTTKANGVFLLESHQVRHFDNRHGLPPTPFYTLLDGGDSLWLTSPSGIYQVPFEQFDQLIAGRLARLQPVVINELDGMRTRECQNNTQPAAWRDPSGDLWFLTVRGVVRIRPSMIRPAEGLRVLLSPPVREQRQFTVRYSTNLISAPHRAEFRYRLAALTSDWISAGTDRVLRFSNLPAGAHTLTVEAREWGGPWGPPAAVTLLQPPRFFETWWFRILVLAVLASLLYLAYRWRIFVLRTRYSAVLDERNRISREWHDTLLAGFSAISWQLDATLKSLATEPGRAAASVETARRMVHHYRAEARRVIWDLRDNQPVSARLEDLAAAALQQAVQGSRIMTQFEVTGQPAALDPDRRLNALRICQESIANAVRHAHPSRIAVHLDFQPQALRIRVTDDGPGFDAASHLDRPSAHFGLTVMRERARRFKGDLRIFSSPGGGTIVEAEIPFQLNPPQ